jgi:hypothetical protein
MQNPACDQVKAWLRAACVLAAIFHQVLSNHCHAFLVASIYNSLAPLDTLVLATSISILSTCLWLLQKHAAAGAVSEDVARMDG